ncbi:MAG: hypothetical protein M9897_11250 [Brumimicrobium sp.]|nr:hypothetical protein [Brumimicrobium sp.]
MEDKQRKIRRIEMTKLTVIVISIFFYGVSIMGTSGVQVSNEFVQQHHSQQIYLGEISKLIFPQTINTSHENVSISQMLPKTEKDLDNAATVSVFLGQIFHQLLTNYVRESQIIELSLPIQDIIFPFHYFW